MHHAVRREVPHAEAPSNHERATSAPTATNAQHAARRMVQRQRAVHSGRKQQTQKERVVAGRGHARSKKNKHGTPRAKRFANEQHYMTLYKYTRHCTVWRNARRELVICRVFSTGIDLVRLQKCNVSLGPWPIADKTNPMLGKQHQVRSAEVALYRRAFAFRKMPPCHRRPFGMLARAKSKHFETLPDAMLAGLPKSTHKRAHPARDRHEGPIEQPQGYCCGGYHCPICGVTPIGCRKLLQNHVTWHNGPMEQPQGLLLRWLPLSDVRCDANLLSKMISK